MTKKQRESQINKIIYLIRNYTFRRGGEAGRNQYDEINGEACGACRKFENKLKREMRKL